MKNKSFNLDLVREYVGIPKTDHTDNDIKQEKIVSHFVSKIKIGNLYVTTDKILGSMYKPLHKKFSNGIPGICWELTVEDLLKEYGLSYENAKNEINFREFFEGCIVLPIKFEGGGHLLQMLCDGKTYWFSSEYLATNTVLVAPRNIKEEKNVPGRGGV